MAKKKPERMCPHCKKPMSKCKCEMYEKGKESKGSKGGKGGKK